MSLIVQKYGGTSLRDLERIRAVATRVAATRAAGHEVAAVVSAMAGETSRLLSLAHELATEPDRRECDVLAATGEQVTSALLTIALRSIECPATSFLGHQIRIATDSAFGRARIKSVDPKRMKSALANGHVVVVPGFQGVDVEGNVTTLGRGGSDTSAVALAAALDADVCEILTDVDGVYTSDPRICPRARKIDRISYDEMLELASLGTKVLQIRSVELAKRHRVPVHVRSSFSDAPGTWVVEEESSMEDVEVSGVASDREAKVTLHGVPDHPGLAAAIFGPVADANISIDMIIQNVSADGTTDVTFTVPRGDLQEALRIVRTTASRIGAGQIDATDAVAKVSIVGLGMRNHAGVAARMFRTLADHQINIQMISTSEIKISILIDDKFEELAVRALSEALVGTLEERA